MIITIKKYNNTLEYQETINGDIENITSKKEQFWKSIYEVIDYSYFGVVNFFPKLFLNQCKYNPNEPQNVPSKVKAAF